MFAHDSHICLSIGRHAGWSGRLLHGHLPLDLRHRVSLLYWSDTCGTKLLLYCPGPDDYDEGTEESQTEGWDTVSIGLGSPDAASIRQMIGLARCLIRSKPEEAALDLPAQRLLASIQVLPHLHKAAMRNTPTASRAQGDRVNGTMA